MMTFVCFRKQRLEYVEAVNNQGIRRFEKEALYDDIYINKDEIVSLEPVLDSNNTLVTLTLKNKEKIIVKGYVTDLINKLGVLHECMSEWV